MRRGILDRRADVQERHVAVAACLSRRAREPAPSGLRLSGNIGIVFPIGT